MISILAAIVVIGALVLVHEYGHFVVARRFNVKVLKFSIGFGPKLYGFQKGETEYLVSAVPLGGYVKLYGEDDGEVPEEPERAFSGQSPLRRMLIVAAGPVFNFVFAFLVLFAINIAGFNTVSTRIGDVREGYPAHAAGLKKGDLITRIDGADVRVWDDITRVVKGGGGKALAVEFVRDGATMTVSLEPRIENVKNMFGEEAAAPVVGIVSSGDLVRVSYPVHVAFSKGVSQVYELTRITVLTVYKLLMRTVPVSSLGGPIMITKLAGETASAGALSLAAFMALLSVNLGVLNLLPIPVLDGGHIILFLYEMATGRPVTPRFREAFMYVGIFIIALLTVTVFYNDIMRIFLKQ